VAFIEVAELEVLEAAGADPAVELVKQQLQELCKEGFELGLHLHPQWYNARFDNGKWLLDYNEYNLCTLPRKRIIQIIERALAYFRAIPGVPEDAPLSFRAGNWLFQPTPVLANVLAQRGIKIDSSVFKGGRQRKHRLDYRPALRNGYYWRFKDAVEIPDAEGALLELPILTQMVPFWRMLTAKRVGLQGKGSTKDPTGQGKLHRLFDLARLRYPLKLDFCRMGMDELSRMVDTVVDEDRKSPALYRPVVAIGHTKDLVDIETVEAFLSYLERKGIPIATFKDAHPKCQA